MFFSPFLALRYLKPKRTAVSIITLISIIGVALGVWITVVVMAVFTGFGETMKRNILGFRPHVEVRSGGYLEDYLEVTDPIAELDGVAHFTPYVFGQVIMDFRGYRRAPQIRAILQPEEGSSELELMNSKIAKRKNPAYDPSNPSQHPEEIPAGEFYLDPYNCVIGDALARGMGLNVGDTFLLYSPKDIGQLMDALDKVEESESSSDRKKGLDNIREMTVPQEVTVAGIFDSGENDADSNIIMLHLETGQTLYNFDLEEAHGVSIRVDDPFAMAELEDELLRLFGNQHHVVTWKQANKVLFDAIAWERMMMYLILSLVVIVGAFCITNTMITVTVQKGAEIGLLKALGSTESQIAKIFLIQGTIVGFIGIIIGVLVAQVTLHFRNDVAMFIAKCLGRDELFPAEIYGLDGGLPAVQTPSDVIAICAAAFLFCVFASLIPAIIAAVKQPAKALRSE